MVNHVNENAVLNSAEGKKKQRTQNDSLYRKTMLKIGIGMLIFYELFSVLSTVAVLVGEILFEIAGVTPLTYTVADLLTDTAYVLGFIVPALILARLLRKQEGYRPIDWKGRVPAIAPMLIISAIALNFAMAYLNSYIVTLILPSQSMDMSSLMDSPTEPYQLLLMFLSTAIIPAVVEEILFRGVVLSNLLPYGKTTAIVGSAVLFGLMHGNILQFLYTTLLGVVIGYIYVQTRSIWVCMLIHFFNNGISVLQEGAYSMFGDGAALRVINGIELFIVGLGAIFAVILLIRYFRKKKPEDEGSFGVIFDSDMEYAQISLSRGVRLRQFFSPTMIIFTVLSCLNMISVLILLMITGAM